MNLFHKLFRWAWSVIVVCSLAFAMGGCEGDDGAQGPAGATGPTGPAGPPGQDLTADPIAEAVAAADIESCATCHDGVGGGHQAIYDEYADASELELIFDNFTSTPNGAVWDVTLTFTILQNGVPFEDYASLSQARFFVNRFDNTVGNNGEFYEAFRSLGSVVDVGPGQYQVSRAGLTFDPTASGQVYGYIALGKLLEHEAGTGGEIPAGSHVHLYEDVANAGIAYGAAGTYASLANPEGCENCHGSPYLKHGYRAAQVPGLADFAACKVCHNDDGNGGHFDWQYMVDEPFNWATGVAATADYSYKRSVMNDAHMSHAMEFPYPMSMSNCATCHAGSEAAVTADEFFTPETCKSCHPVQGIDAWPEDAGTTMAGLYAQPHRAPPMQFLWTRAGVEGFHDIGLNCQGCHAPNPPNPAVAPLFSDYHSGWDDHIYDDTGTKFADLNTVAIDNITLAGDLMTIEFSSNNVDIVPEVLVSFYGWDTRNYLVGSHERDANVTECGGRRPGCKMEYVPESSGGGPNPLFTEDPASVPGDWMVTLDMSALQLTKTDLLPTLIANGDITKAEISITPELEVGGEDVVLKAVGETFDLAGSMIVADYFKGANAAVSIEKCNACHDSLASTFHDGSGRGGDGIEVCKHCHTTTFPGSHLELQSRAIDSYIHGIHSFQQFDLDEVAAANDPVFDARAEQHIKHTFPNFTIRNCEACHLAGTYDVPDQSKSMPGVLSRGWDISDRAIGTVPEYVTGPASRACGGCHRADFINADNAGELASFMAHTDAFGTLVVNDDPDSDADNNDQILFGIIDKLMSMFE